MDKGTDTPTGEIDDLQGYTEAEYYVIA